MTGGTIIRLIDVVLIILFGFLFITDYQAKSHLPLPQVAERKEEQRPEDEDVYRVIEIFRRVQVDAPYYWYGNTAGDERILRRVTQHDQLVETLRDELALHGDRLEIVIVPLSGARLRWVVDVYDICRALGIEQPIVRVERDYTHMTSRS